MNNETRELSIDELSHVSGGDYQNSHFSVMSSPTGTILGFGENGPTIIVGKDGSISSKGPDGGWTTTHPA
jgi:bacteriocin-like protein